MSARQTVMLVAAMIAAVYGFGSRKTGIELSEVAAIPSPSSTRGKASSG